MSVALRAAVLAFVALLALTEGPAQIACVLVLVFAGVTRRNKGKNLFPKCRTTELGLLVWLLAGYAALAFADEQVSSGAATRPLMAFAYPIGLLLGTPRSPVSLKLATKIFVFALVLNACFGIAQVFLGETPLDAIFLKNPDSPQIYRPGHAESSLRAASGFFYNRLKLAHTIIFSIPIFAELLFRGRSRPAKQRFLDSVGFSIVSTALYFTFARSAWLAFFAGVATVIFLQLLQRQRERQTTPSLLARAARVFVAIVVAGVTIFVGLKLAEGRLATFHYDLDRRFALLKAGYQVFQESPWFGVGHGVYPHRATQYLRSDLQRIGVLSTSAHNALAHVLAETGVIGLLGFLLAVGGALHAVSRLFNKTSSPATQGTGRVLIALWVALFFIGLFHQTFHHVPVALAFFVTLGIANQLARNQEMLPQNERTEVPHASPD